jgi:hypothetical protein
VNDEPRPTGGSSPNSNSNGGISPERSPLHPPRPTIETHKVEPPKPAYLQETVEARAVTPSPPENPSKALENLRGKMEAVANEFAAGKINRAQFNAIYARYSEQRTIIERLIARNPDNPAWKQAATPGHTSFLRDHFQARIDYYAVFRHQISRPLVFGGQKTPDVRAVGRVLQSLWGMSNRPKTGLARKDMGDGHWLVLAMGEYALTLVMFTLEPSVAQMQWVRDLHADFERANRSALERNTQSLERMVFPQRALVG